LTSPGAPPLAFRSSPEPWRSAAVALPHFHATRQLPPLRFLSPSAFSRWRPATYPRGYQPPGYAAFSAFRTLPRPSSARHLPALFHAGPAHGVLPFRVSLHSRSDRLFRASCPLVVCLLSCRCTPCCGFLQSSLGLHSHSAATFLWTAAFLQQPHFRALLPAGDRSFDFLETGSERRDPRGLHPP
jgi:hypothetical protein